MIDPGKMIQRVTILRDSLGAPSATGERVKTYGELITVWAEVRTLVGREVEQARTRYPTVTHTVKIRYVAGISVTYRVKWGDQLFVINAVVDAQNTREELVLYCTEEVKS